MKQRNTRTNNPTYQTIHWYLRRFKKGICKKCSKVGKTHLALRHGKKHERKLSNYKELCVKCHIAYDTTKDRQIKWLNNLAKSWNHKNRIILKKCEHCADNFMPAKKSRRFCSNFCSKRWLALHEK